MGRPLLSVEPSDRYSCWRLCHHGTAIFTAPGVFALVIALMLNDAVGASVGASVGVVTRCRAVERHVSNSSAHVLNMRPEPEPAISILCTAC